ncbi:fibrous sheath CABYR-binding protein [Maniola hyperantus]|uniref:fibrous sheath CABYR-binding protein n=1 Tax=Aphantopus hyperantus TaxID=2795564 RepID=UPI001568C67D|nr:fibrous sheath CABYR-binding protein [Maniola hyperantus]
MEKEHQPDSMATITMKPEYPPSEVYSASEPPPAYRQRPSSSVQIARIAALTVVASAFILGSFILASSWVAARASCHQLEQLDAMLDKELALEGRSYGNDALMPEELPIANAHALHAPPPPPAVDTTSVPAQHKPAALSPDSLLKADPLNHAESKIDEDKLQKIDDDKTDTANSGSDESSESDSSAEDDDDELIRPMFKLPIQFDLDELAGAFLANNQKGRMNCVVEKRQEEPMERRFPFNILGAFAPRSAQAERIAIICHGGDERPMPMFPDPQSQVFAFPLSGPVRLPIRPAPAPERAEPRGPFGMPQRNSPFPLPMPWDSSEEQMNVPREMRIHVQRVIAIPSPHNMPPAPENMGPFQPPPPPPQPQENEREPEEMTAPRQMRVIAIPAPHNMPPPQDNMGPFQPPPPPQAQDQNEQSAVLHQFVPQPAPTQDMEQPEVQKMQMEGSPIQMNLPWDLTPEDLHMIHRTAQEAVANQRREQQIDNDMQEVKSIVNTLAAAEVEAEQAQAQDRQQAPRAPRTLLLPQDMPVDQRPHYMQPRSVRSVDSPLHREKRVKRCSCACR